MTGLPARDRESLPELYGADRSALIVILATLKLRSGWGLIARDVSGRSKGYLVQSFSRSGTCTEP